MGKAVKARFDVESSGITPPREFHAVTPPFNWYSIYSRFRYKGKRYSRQFLI